MSTLFFISQAPRALPNWLEAFPSASFFSGMPRAFGPFDRSIIIIDFMNLAKALRVEWLDKAIKTEQKVIVLSPTPDKQEAIAVIKSGAVGYGHTLVAPVRLREMVLVVNHGGLWLGSNLLQNVLNNIVANPSYAKPIDNKPKDSPFERLTEREKVVAKHLALGQTNAEISEAMAIGERAVKAHMTSIFSKLKVDNRVKLALLLNGVQLPELSIRNSSNASSL